MNQILNVKVNQQVKKKAKRIADDLGLTLSGVVNAYLRQFIRSGTLFVSRNYEEPSAFLRETIREAEIDRKNKKQFSFNSAEEALGFIDSIIARKRK